MIGIKEAAQLLGVDASRVRVLCAQGRIPRAKRIAGVWVLPSKPVVIAASRTRPGKINMKEPTK